MLSRCPLRSWKNCPLCKTQIGRNVATRAEEGLAVADSLVVEVATAVQIEETVVVVSSVEAVAEEKLVVVVVTDLTGGSESAQFGTLPHQYLEFLLFILFISLIEELKV